MIILPFIFALPNKSNTSIVHFVSLYSEHLEVTEGNDNDTTPASQCDNGDFNKSLSIDLNKLLFYLLGQIMRINGQGREICLFTNE